jgi:hypothetical protein
VLQEQGENGGGEEGGISQAYPSYGRELAHGCCPCRVISSVLLLLLQIVGVLVCGQTSVNVVGAGGWAVLPVSLAELL